MSGTLPVKPWWQSRTIIGVAVLVFSQVLKYLNVDIVDQELTDIITLVLDTAGAGLAIYGRVKARKALTATVPGGPFNPRANVRRAKRAGHASVLAMVFAFWIAAGVLSVAGWAQRCGDKPLSDWIKTVPVEDQRPFFTRLLSSLSLTPTTVVVRDDRGNHVKITKLELRGGAEF